MSTLLVNDVATGRTLWFSVTAVGPVASSVNSTGPSPFENTALGPVPLNVEIQFAEVVFQAALTFPSHRRIGMLEISRSIRLAAVLLTSDACMPAGSEPSVKL